MVVLLGDMIEKIVEYEKVYKETKERKEGACVFPVDVYNLLDGRKCGEDIESKADEVYREARKNCNLYFKALDELEKYEKHLNREIGDEYASVVACICKENSSNDIAYFTLQADVSKFVEVTKENVGVLAIRIKDLGYQSFRYHEAMNFEGTDAEFGEMFENFYKEFAPKNEYRGCDS